MNMKCPLAVWLMRHIIYWTVLYLCLCWRLTPEGIVFLGCPREYTCNHMVKVCYHSTVSYKP